MKWEKKGLIIEPCDARIPYWGKKRIMLPTPVLINDVVIRLYVGLCGKDNVGRVGYIDVSAHNPSEVLSISQDPVFDIGSAGTFDERGVVPTYICKKEKDLLLFYGGFSADSQNEYYMFEGLAISENSGRSFKRVLDRPLLEKSSREGLFRVGSFVCEEGEKWKMWYIGGDSWRVVNGKKMPVYRCNYLESKNFRSWGTDYINCLDFISVDEHGFSRPWVIRKNDVYKMFYSIRKINTGYSPGYAESIDGKRWTRKDNHAGIKLSANGWDSKMITYPAVVFAKERAFLFYSGNNNGEGGLGYAEMPSVFL